MERRRLSHSDDGALPYLAKRRKTGFQGIEDESIRERYTVAWICALHIEMAAARAMLDEEHADCPRQGNDTNSYVLGSIQNHNVAIACLPTDQYGTSNAASVLSNMRRTFPNIQIGLIVGIGGGVPLKADIRLGDIVVGIRVMQYDMGKTFSGRFKRTAVPKIPDSTIRTVISNLRSRHELNGSRVPSILREKMGSYAAYSRPSEPDRLFQQSYHHPPSFLSCNKCDSSRLETRKKRLSTDPAIHYGGIGSANTVMKDSAIRDEIAHELDVLCFEMEAAGLMDIMPCLPIRSICDYSDSHKAKEWQRYAAATAGAFAYEFLELWRRDYQASYTGYHHAPVERPMTLDHERRHEKILESLKFEQIDTRKLTIEAAHSKTCRWFLNHPDYLSWMDQQQISQHHGFLWIRGKPGAGKSTIMKFIYQESKKKDLEHQSLTASFFFNARGQVLEKTVSGIYRSLIRQLLNGFKDLRCVLDDPELLSQSQSGCPSLNGLKDLLRAAVARLGQRSFTCFIDALDECDEQQVMDLVEYFEDLAEQCTENHIDLRVCFSSRHYPYIDMKYGIRVILEEQVGHGSDLESYIKTHLRIKDRSILADLQSKMLVKAAGVFLWVVLVVDLMNKENSRGRMVVRRRLEQVPSGLSDLFKDLLKRDKNNMGEFQLSLLLILLCERPLKPEEYYHAIWSGLYLEGLADLDMPEVDTEDSDDCFASCVVSSSRGLAEITKDRNPRVQFIHQSVRDFLVKDNGLQEIWPELGPDWESVGHEKLKLCCYSYFQAFIIKRSLKVGGHALSKFMCGLDTTIYPFLEYASQFILHHSEGAANTSDQQSFLDKFPTTHWKEVVNMYKTSRAWGYSSAAGLLYILADRGHSLLIRTRLKSHPDIYMGSRNDQYVYPLTAAMAKGDKASVIALLGLTSSLYDRVDITEGLVPKIDLGGAARTPLSWACENGYLGIARVLFERDAQPANVGGRGHSLMMLASRNGHTDIVRWLISHAANIDDERDLNESAIWLATSNGDAEIVELLLDAGSDPNACAVIDSPILCLAVEKGHRKVVNVLLKRGANVKVTNYWMKTPLHLAAGKEGSKVAMQALISCGADINARDYHGSTPLISAVAGASVDEIGFSIGQGADVTAQDNKKNTCLHEAMNRSKKTFEIVRLLMGNGARPDVHNRIGQTCLHSLARRGSGTPSIGDVIQLITSCGVDINSNDNLGNTPLHEVAQAGAMETLSTFADQPGVDLNARNHLGKTPLHLAASRFRLLGTEGSIIEAIEKLIRKGADINSVDNESRTPLDDAVEAGYESVMQFLIDNGGRRGVT